MHHQNARCINEHWRFHLGDVSSVAVGATDDLSWIRVALPHSWNALDTMETEASSHYMRAVGWYAREIEAPLPGERLWVEVEAASQRASIWQDGRQIGTHAGGYTAFTFELVQESQERSRRQPLLCALRVDNLPDPNLIPSDMSDFFLYGGLTRNVWSYTTGPSRLVDLHCETEVRTEAAILTVSGRLDSPPPRPLDLVLQLFSPQGKLLASLAGTIDEESFVLPACEIEQPDLWSPAQPFLYTLEARLLAGVEVWDAVTERFGLRFFTFPAGGPLLFNGQPLILHGTHRHEDWAGMGSAVPVELTRQEMRQIKEAGFNFVRLGHYPQSPAVLEACDELGLLVWEELPWCRGGIGGDLFCLQTRTMLFEMIEQHYNHPSIIMWGLGNELDWDSEHPGSTNEQIVDFLGELHRLAHLHDPNRLTALRRFEHAERIVDVYSPSLWSGWYVGRYEEYAAGLAHELACYPRMLHMEWGGDSHFGRHAVGEHFVIEPAQQGNHAEHPGLATSLSGPPRASRDGDWSESYMLDLMEWHLQVQLRTPQFAGGAQWIFKDFGTPLRPENPMPYVNQKGLVDRAGRPKDLYYLFQSYLTTEPMCYIESPTWTIRTGGLNEAQRVRVYSNCPRVSLFVNKRSCGELQRSETAFPAAGLVWWVLFQPGQNELHAVGVSAAGQRVEHMIMLEYQEAASGLGVGFRSQVQAIVMPDGKEGSQVTIRLLDEHGHLVINDRRRVTFVLQGAGTLLGCLGCAGGCGVIELTNGMASIVVLTTEETTLLVVAEDLPDTVIALKPEHFPG